MNEKAKTVIFAGVEVEESIVRYLIDDLRPAIVSVAEHVAKNGGNKAQIKEAAKITAEAVIEVMGELIAERDKRKNLKPTHDQVSSEC